LLPFDQITDQLFGAGTAFVEMPITASIVTAMRDLPRETVPDMPDRIIAATAKYLGVPLVTRDLRIRSLALATVW
jgi:predicted nucleic acid-binding protein